MCIQMNPYVTDARIALLCVAAMVLSVCTIIDSEKAASVNCREDLVTLCLSSL